MTMKSLRKMKEQLEELISDLDCLDRVGVYYDRNWGEVTECGHHPEYIRIADLDKVIEKLKNLVDKVE